MIGEIGRLPQLVDEDVPKAITRKEVCMSILWMIVIGLVIGAFAKLVMPGRDPGGLVITMLLGIAGSIVAGFIGRSAGWYAEGEPAGFIASVLGAILLLFLYRAITSRNGAGSSGIGKAA